MCNLVDSDDVNLLEESVSAVKGSIETVLYTSKKAGLHVYTI